MEVRLGFSRLVPGEREAETPRAVPATTAALCSGVRIRRRAIGDSPWALQRCSNLLSPSHFFQRCSNLLSPSHRCSGYPAAHHAGAFEYLIVGAEDVPGYNIAQHFPETNSFIDNGRRQGAVFVHCFAGMSRAPSAVMAYLMWAQGLSLKEAASTVKAARRQTQPNSGFWKQLEEYHAQQPQGRWGSRQGGQQGGGKGRPIYVSGQRDAW